MPAPLTLGWHADRDEAAVLREFHRSRWRLMPDRGWALRIAARERLGSALAALAAREDNGRA